MSKFARMIDVLDLFSDTDTLLTAEDIASKLDVSRPTAFRYVRELSGAGFLANYSGSYSLGARIITLDYRIRQSDPIVRAARAPVERLSAETGCSALLCRMYNEEVVNVFDVPGYDEPSLNPSGRGRPLPLFRGAASKIMVAALSKARLKKMYERHKQDKDVLAFGHSWEEFKDYYAAIKKAGQYISNQEVDADSIGIAAPINVRSVGTVAVLSLVFSANRLKLLNINGLAITVRQRCLEISRELIALSEAKSVSKTLASTPDRSKPPSKETGK